MESLLHFDQWGILFVFSMMIAMGLIIFGGVEMLFVGIVIVLLNAGIIHEEDQKVLDKRFVIEQFQSGQKIECGLWRGSRTLVDPAKGWSMMGEDRFIKGDQIMSDVGLCSVVGKESPEDLWKGSTLFALVIFTVTILARIGIHAGREPNKETEESDDESEHN